MISDRPEVLTVDAQNRPHNETGPFCRWRDGFSLYYWHGVQVPAWIIEHPEQITASTIQAEQNAEVRRVMITRLGAERYLRELDATETARDDFGILYHSSGQEPIAIVKVVNGTPEADGSYKDYFLFVPPAMRTARQAVAWTYGMEEQEYAPVIRT